MSVTRPHSQTRNVALFLAASALIDMGIYGVMDVLLNFYYRSLDFDLAMISVLQGSQRLGALLFALPAGLLVTRLGARRALMIAGVGLSVALVGMTLAPAFAWQYGVRLLLGTMYTTVFIASIPMVASLVTRERYTSVFAGQFVAVSLAVALANSIGGSLPTFFSGLIPVLGSPESSTAYAASLVAAAVLVALSLVPLALLPQAAPLPADRPHTRTSAPWGAILLMSAPMLIFGVGAGLSIPYYNLFFRDTFRLSDAAIGNIFTLGSVAMLTITLVVPAAARRLGQVNALAAAMIATTAAFFLLGQTPGVQATIILYMLAFGLRNTMTPLYNPLLLDHVNERHHGLVSSISTGAWSLGFLLITFFSGGWVEQFGYPFLFRITALTTLLTGAAALVIFHTLRGLRQVAPAASPGDGWQATRGLAAPNPDGAIIE